MSRLRSLSSILILSLALSAVGCAHDSGATAGTSTAGQRDIVDTAIAAGSFTTLVAAVEAAGLVDTLRGPGPFTVFAPTDEAFAALPPGTVESLLRPENRDRLRAILTYHVVAGDVRAAQVVTMSSATTVQGSSVNIRTQGSNVMVNDATVVQADVGCANGVIHVIDHVILPPE